MATLPEGWEFDYDGARWLYRYKSTGAVQYHFPRDGDEFAEFFGPVEHTSEQTPQERLESERQKRKAGLAKTSPVAAEAHASSSKTPTSATLSRGDFLGSSFDMFGFLGPDSFNDTADDEGDSGHDPVSKDLGKPNVPDDPTMRGIVEADSTPASTQQSTPNIVNSQPVRDTSIPETTAGSSTTAPVTVHELADANVLGGRHNPVGNISELADSSLHCIGDLNPPPVELPGNDAAFGSSTGGKVEPMGMITDSTAAVSTVPQQQPGKEAAQAVQSTEKQQPADDSSAGDYRPFRISAETSDDTSRRHSYVRGGPTVAESQDRELRLVKESGAHKESQIPIALQPARPPQAEQPQLPSPPPATVRNETEPTPEPAPGVVLKAEATPSSPDLPPAPLLSTAGLTHVPSVLKPASGRLRALSATGPKEPAAAQSGVPSALTPLSERQSVPGQATTPSQPPVSETTTSSASKEAIQQQLPAGQPTPGSASPAPLSSIPASAPAPLALSSATPSSTGPAAEPLPAQPDLVPAPLRIARNSSQGSQGSQASHGRLTPITSGQQTPAQLSEQPSGPGKPSDSQLPLISAPLQTQADTSDVVPAPLKTASSSPQPSSGGFSVPVTSASQLMTALVSASTSAPAPVIATALSATASAPLQPLVQPVASQNIAPSPLAPSPTTPVPMSANFASAVPKPKPLQTAKPSTPLPLDTDPTSSSTGPGQTQESKPSATEMYSGLMLVDELRPQPQPQPQQQYPQQFQKQFIQRKPTVQRKPVNSPKILQSPGFGAASTPSGSLPQATPSPAAVHRTSISSASSQPQGPSGQSTPGSERAPTPAMSIHSAHSFHDQQSSQTTATPPPPDPAQVSWQQQQQQQQQQQKQQSPVPSVSSVHRDSLPGSMPSPPVQHQAVPHRMSVFGVPGTPPPPATSSAVGLPPATTQQGQPGQQFQGLPQHLGSVQNVHQGHRMSLSGIPGHPTQPGQPERPAIQPFFAGPPLALGGTPPPLPKRDSQYGQASQDQPQRPQQPPLPQQPPRPQQSQNPQQTQQQKIPLNAGFLPPKHSHTMPLPTMPHITAGAGQGRPVQQAQPQQQPYPGKVGSIPGGSGVPMSPQTAHAPYTPQPPERLSGARPQTVPPQAGQAIGPPAFSSGSGSRLLSRFMNSTPVQMAASKIAGAAVGPALGLSGAAGAQIGTAMYSAHQASKRQEQLQAQQQARIQAQLQAQQQAQNQFQQQVQLQTQLQAQQQAKYQAQQQALEQVLQQAQQQALQQVLQQAQSQQPQQRPPLPMAHTAPAQLQHGIPQNIAPYRPTAQTQPSQQQQGPVRPPGVQQGRPPVSSNASAPPGQLYQTQMAYQQSGQAPQSGGQASQPQQQPQNYPGQGANDPSQQQGDSIAGNQYAGQGSQGQQPDNGIAGNQYAGQGSQGQQPDSGIAGDQYADQGNQGQQQDSGIDANQYGDQGNEGQQQDSGIVFSQYLGQGNQDQQQGGGIDLSQLLGQGNQGQEPGSGIDLNLYLDQSNQGQLLQGSGIDFSQYLDQSGQAQQQGLYSFDTVISPEPAPSFEVVTSTQIDFVGDNGVVEVDQTETFSMDTGGGWAETVDYSGGDWVGGDWVGSLFS